MAVLNKLSDITLRRILGKPYNGQSLLSDGASLSARVSKNGSISWVYRYRLGGRESNPKWLTLGSYPDTSIKQAREKRDQCRAWLDDGKDPSLEMQLKHSKTLAPVSIEEALEYWLCNYAKDHRSNVEKHRSQFRKHIYPFIGHLPVEQVETRHWLDCFDRATKGVPAKGQKPAPVASGAVLQNAKQALKFCRVRRYAISRALDDLTIPDVGRKPQKRERYLTAAEFQDVIDFAKYGKASLYYKNLLLLMLVFGGRTGEFRLSTWAEWDFDTDVWTVPPEHSKSGSAIYRPIPPAVRGWLLELKAENQRSGYLLGELKLCPTVSQWGRGVWKKLNHEQKWTLHDFRRTLATHMNDLGIQPHIVEHILGHMVSGVAGIYNRSQYMEQKRAALDLWIKYVLAEKSDHCVAGGSACP